MGYDRIGPGLSVRMKNLRGTDQVDVNIFLKGEHAQTLVKEGPAVLALEGADSTDSVIDAGPVAGKVADELRKRCQVEQQDLIQMLAAESASNLSSNIDAMDGEPAPTAPAGGITSYWINNSVGVTITRDMLAKIMERDDVAYVEVERHVDIEELLDAPGSTGPGAGGMDPTVSGGLAIDGGVDASVVTWSVNRVNAPGMWQLGFNGAGVLVAVIDTGVNYLHPDLKSHMWNGGSVFPNHGYNFAENNDDPMDQQGHGTACAGQVAGDGASGTQTGVAPGATIMAIRVGGAERNFWNGMQFAVTHQADVISMSMSWKYPRSPNYPGWRRVCETVLAAGILHANSIGNQGHLLSTHPIPFNIATPGNCPPPWLHPLQAIHGGVSSAISCGATDDLDQLAYYSGRGPAEWDNPSYKDYPWQSGAQPGLIKPDICAPGPGTMSCNWPYAGPGTGNAYRSFGGTSAATPHVGGCLALLAQACKQAGTPIVPARVQEAIENSAATVAGQTQDKENHYGSGRIDVLAAYNDGHSRGWW